MNKILKYFDMIIFTTTLIIIDVIFRLIIGFPLLSLKPIFFNTIIIVILLSIIFCFNKRTRIIIEIILITLFSLYTFSQAFHYIFFNTVFSLRKITIINELWGVKDTIFSKFDRKLLLFIMPPLFYFVVIIIFKNHIGYIPNKKKYIISSILLIITLSYLIYAHFQPVNKTKDDIENEVELYHSMSNKNKFINRYGLYTFLYRDLESIFTENKKKEISDSDKQWIDNYISNKQHVENDYTGILEGKNLILIQAESFCPQVIDEYLTPTLYELMKNSLYFDNFYCPLYPENTCDTEFITQNSLIPSIDYGATSKEFARNNYKYSLANLFKYKNYSANSYHSFLKDFYNRTEFHEALGFSYLYDYQDMSLYKPDYYVDYYDWIDDIELIKGTLQNTNLLNNYYDFIITTSGHLPYMDLRPELYEFQGKANEYLKVDPETAYYYASQMKFDESIKYLIDYLDANDLINDTVIVIYGDHYPYGVNESTQKYLYSDLTNEYEIYKVPLYIINPSLPKEKISKLCSSFDLLPTLANLFNLDISNSFYIGNDIFSDDNCVVRFYDGSILTDEEYYDVNQHDSGDITDNMKKEIVFNSELMKYSQLFLLSDYYNLKTK